MTNVKIDPATGLPELPEGYFWRVGEPSYHLEGYPFRSGVAIMRPHSNPRWSDVGPFFTKEHPDYEYRNDVYYNVWGRRFVEVRYRPRWEKVFEIINHEPFMRVTADTLPKVAEETYLAWQERLRELREWDDLQGDYPPKSVKGAPVGETD